MEAHMPDVSTEEFEALRPRLFGIAYRMTGSVGDAEDACQDAWLRWQRVDRAPSTTPRRTSCGWSPGSPSTGCSRRSTGARPTSVPTCPSRWWPTTPRRDPRKRGRAELADSLTLRLPRAARRAHAEGARGAVAARRVRLRRSTRSRRWSTCHPRRAGRWRAAPVASSTTSATSLRRPDEAARARARRQPARHRRPR